MPDPVIPHAPASTLRQIAEPSTLNQQTGVWHLVDGDALPYPNDAFAAKDLEGILLETPDLSSLSPILNQYAGAWPASYYLSARRTSLLRGFEWDASCNAIEIGAGCGTITRFLGETFDSVLAIEGESHRSKLCRLRTRDLVNVQVLNAALDQLSFTDRFDFLFSIGVLEYASFFQHSGDPFLEMLERCRETLTDDGTLVLAIENQLGLKYFAGAAEDHTALPFDGIEGYHRSRHTGAMTMNRRALDDLLGRAGFTNIEFFFPFPDYKFASCVLTSAAAETRDGGLAALISNDKAGEYPPTGRPLLFNQSLAWNEIVEAGLLPDLANSFLVMASRGTTKRWSAPWDAISFSIGKRRPQYWSATGVTHLDTDKPSIQRMPLLGEPGPRADDFISVTLGYEEPWHGEPTLGVHLSRLMQAPDCSAEDIAELLIPWRTYLDEHVLEGDLLDGQFVDATPWNLIVIDDHFEPIDRELRVFQRIPKKILLIRGLYQSIVMTSDIPDSLLRLRGRRFWSIVKEILLHLDVSVTFLDLVRYVRFEHRLRGAIAEPSVSLPQHMLEAYGQRLAVLDMRQYLRSHLGKVRHKLFP